MRHSPNEAQLTAELLAIHGELVSGKALRMLLGFQSERTYLRAIQENNIPVALVKLEGRKGHFARIRDVAHWLCRLNDDK